MMPIQRYKIWLLTGAVLGLLAVALGAFGAHALESHLEKQGLTGIAFREKLATWDTAAQYQMYHALALLAVGLLAARRCGLAINLAGTAMTLGTLLFSGCLYAWVLGGPLSLVALVPVGGVVLMAGWACLFVAILRMGASEANSPPAR